MAHVALVNALKYQDAKGVRQRGPYAIVRGGGGDSESSIKIAVVPVSMMSSLEDEPGVHEWKTASPLKQVSLSERQKGIKAKKTKDENDLRIDSIEEHITDWGKTSRGFFMIEEAKSRFRMINWAQSKLGSMKKAILLIILGLGPIRETTEVASHCLQSPLSPQEIDHLLFHDQ